MNWWFVAEPVADPADPLDEAADPVTPPPVTGPGYATVFALTSSRKTVFAETALLDPNQTWLIDVSVETPVAVACVSVSSGVAESPK